MPNWRLNIVALALAVGPLVGRAVAADVQHLVLLLPSRPVFVRLEARLGERDFRTAWKDYSQRLFHYLDHNGDGRLTNHELGGALHWWDEMQALSSGRTAEDADPLEDDEITFAEWTEVGRHVGQQVRCVSRRAPESSSQELWSRLDRNSDRALSRQELESSYGLLARLDFDQNEIIEASELRPYENPLNRYFRQQTAGVAGGESEEMVRAYSPNEVDRPFVDELFARYNGRSPDAVLSTQEIGLDQETLARFDTDDSGSLSVGELARLLRKPPCQLALAVQLGPDTPAEKRVEFLQVDGRPAALESYVARQADGSLLLAIGSEQVRLTAVGNGLVAAGDSALKTQFKSSDRDGNGYLDQKEAGAGQPFRAMDRNGDDKVFEDEYLAWAGQQAELAQSRVQLTSVDHGRVLFDVVDANRDGRLAQRELKEAAGKLPKWDTSGNGLLAEDEIPHTIVVTIASGPAIAMEIGGSGTPQRVISGPRWFQRMDANADGDLSIREFLGTRQQFQSLDADRDSLVDASEAARRKSDE